MDPFEELRRIALQQSTEGEFPTWLMADVMVIADGPEQYADKVHLVEILITQIGNFDLYAGTGCFDNSVGTDTIQATIRQLGVRQHNGHCSKLDAATLVSFQAIPGPVKVN